MILIILSFVACIFTFSSGINSYDEYDFLEGVSLAEASLKSGSIINKEFIYYYIIPFGPNLIMMPFVKLLGLSLYANQLGMLVFLCIYVFVVFRLANELFDNKLECISFFSFLSLFIYTYIGDNLFHHILVYGIGFVCFLGELSCILKICKNNNSIINNVLLILFCLWAASNGIASAVLSNIPILCSLLGVELWQYYCKKEFRNIIPITMIIVFTVVGLIIFKYYDNNALSLGEYNERFMLDSNINVVHKIQEGILVDILNLFYYNPKGESVFSLKGLWLIFRFGFAFLILLIPLIHCIKAKFINRKQTIFEYDKFFFIIANLLVMMVSLSHYVLVSTSIQRYLFNFALSLFIIDAYIFVNDFSKKTVCSIVLLLAVLLLTYKTIFHTYQLGLSKKEKYITIENILEEKKTNYGYVFRRRWKTLEVISCGNIRNSVVGFNDIKNKLYVANDRVYLNEKYKPENIDKYYIIVDSRYDTEDMASLLKNNLSKIEIDDGFIYFFDISSWDDMFYVNDEFFQIEE